MVTDERVSNIEAVLAKFMEQSSMILAAIHEYIAEIRASNARIDRQLLEIQQQAEEDRRQARIDTETPGQHAKREYDNRWWAELSDKRGTLIEDMVAPCGFQLAGAVFRVEEAQTSGIRIKRKHPTQAGEMMELDMLAVGPTKVLIVEVKRRMDTEKAAQLHAKVAAFPEFFPEYAGKTVLCAVASVYLEPSVIAFLNRERIYGIAMGDETMQVVNLGQF